MGLFKGEKRRYQAALTGIETAIIKCKITTSADVPLTSSRVEPGPRHIHSQWNQVRVQVRICRASAGMRVRVHVSPECECGNATGVRECDWNAGMRECGNTGMRVECGNASGVWECECVCGNATVTASAGMDRESVGRVQECEYGSSRACVRMLDPGHRLLNLVFGDRPRPCQVIIVVVS
jgi:hypothetical protein